MIYADSTFIIACKVREDTFHQPAQDFYEAHLREHWLWSPWQRVEVFNSIRLLTRHPDAKRRLLVPDARRMIWLLQEDVRVGYLTHREADWRDVLRAANEISASHGFELACRSADLLHVAYAWELAAQLFVSFDGDQLALAAAAGLAAVRPQV